MRRALVLCAVLGSIASGLGCKVVTGTCDCHYDPAASTLHPPDGKSPYATVGSPVTNPGVAVPHSPAVMPAPVDKSK